MVTNRNVLSKRTAEEQIKLMEELKKYNYNRFVFDAATSSDGLNEKSFEDKIKYIKKVYIEALKMQPIVVNHGENMEEISDVTEFKSYLKALKQELGKDADVRSDTAVPNLLLLKRSGKN